MKCLKRVLSTKLFNPLYLLYIGLIPFGVIAIISFIIFFTLVPIFFICVHINAGLFTLINNIIEENK